MHTVYMNIRERVYLWAVPPIRRFNPFQLQKKKDLRRAKDASDEWVLNVNSIERNHERSIRPSTWEPPPLGWLKCNFDCSYNRDDAITGGWMDY